MSAAQAHESTAEPRRERPISFAAEKKIARDLSPSIAWPTVALAVLLPLILGGLIYAGLSGAVAPAWLTLPIAFISYAHYSLVHESIHGNVVAAPRSLAFVNVIVGWIGSIGLGMGWPILQRTHVLHHSHTNTEKDPDISVKGTFWQLMWKWAVGIPQSLVPYFLLPFIARGGYSGLRSILSVREVWLSSLPTLFTLALLGVAIATGHVLDWLLLWFLPTRLAVLMLMVFFQWLPHYPFDRTDRYGATRISLWPGGDVILLLQNLHLMHHLWPGVPFYNYRRLFVALRPLLVAEGSRIEGLGVGPWARRIELAEPAPRKAA